MKTKDRRHSGRTTGKSTIRVKKQTIINNCLEPRTFWNDWNDYRDGFRSIWDATKFKSKHLIKQLMNWDDEKGEQMNKINVKIKKKEMIRRKRK